MRDRTLPGRFGQPEDVANVALFLACAESSYVTAIDIVVDGGMKVW
jgi:NAD(P)-dependent dehydrogenase (short-subunit alcohol dehydrogenase family)